VSVESRRQWRVVLETVERAQQLPGFTAAILIGSFAAERADDLSDVDLVIAIADGSFADAWTRRNELHSDHTLFSWDVRPEPEREVGAHKWITRDLVLVEALLAAPAARARLADPHRILAGDATAVGGFNRTPPIERADLADYAAKLAREGHTPDAQLRYEELVRTLRAVSSTRP
jgi:predicted nucleotidyltransferase